MTENDFGEYRLKILGDIQRQNDSLIKLQDIVAILAVEVGQLKISDKIRSGFYGGIGGVITAAILSVLLERIL